MTKEELKAKFNRISQDPSQAQMFVNDLLDGKIPVGVTTLDMIIEGEEPTPTQEQLKEAFEKKPDILRVSVLDGYILNSFYRSESIESENTLDYFNITDSDGTVQVLRFSYDPEKEEYEFENYEWELAGQGGGGTQLYKHTVTINADYGDGDMTETLIFINDSSSSLVGLEMNEINNYVEGFIVENARSENEALCSIIAKPKWDNNIYYYSLAENQVTGNGQWTSSVLTDTITPL